MIRTTLPLLLLALSATAADGRDASPAPREPAVFRFVQNFGTSDDWQPQGSLTWRTTLSNPGGLGAREGQGVTDESLSLHTGRLLVGGRGVLPGRALDWNLLLGGTLAANSRYEQRILTPEGRLDLAWRAGPDLGLTFSSRHGWREANRFMADSLRRRDWVTALGLRYTNEYLGELSARAGNRRAYLEGNPEDTRFVRGDLAGTLPGGMRVRAFGETLGYGLEDSLDFDLARNQVGLSVTGALPWDGHQHGELQRRWQEGRVHWLVNERVSLRPLPGHLLEARFGSDWSEWQRQDLFRRHYHAAWNWSPAQVWGLRLLGEGAWLRLDNADVDHERAVLAGPWLHTRPLGSLKDRQDGLRFLSDLDLQASLDAGLKQSVRWGDGVDVRFRDALLVPMRLHPSYGLTVEQRMDAEWLTLQDGDLLSDLGRPLATETPHELDSRLFVAGESGPWLGGSLRLGHRHGWQRHIGSEIVFPLDSLRNTLQHEAWARVVRGGQQWRASVSHIRHTQALPGREIEYRCALGWLAHPGRMVSGGGELVWRPRRDLLDERLWLRLHGDCHWRLLSARLQAEFSGASEDLGRRDTRCWFQLSRKLW